MSNVYEGKPDSRQSDDINMKTSPFRPKYRALSEEEKTLHDNIKSRAQELLNLYEEIPAGRYRSLAVTDLESSVMWAIKQLTQ